MACPLLCLQWRGAPLNLQTTVTCERYETRKMATGELQVLRHRYKAADTAYMVSVQALSNSSQRGKHPAEDVLNVLAKGLALAADRTRLR